MVVGFAKYLGGRLVAGAKSIGDAVVQSGVKSVSAIIDSGKAVKDFATKVVTDAADKFRGHFSDDVPGGDDASTLPAVEPLQIELRLALEPADRKFIDLLRMMSHRATVDDGDPLPPLPPEASWASSEKTLLQLSLTYDEWPGARRDDGKQLMRWRPASDRSLRVQVGSYSRAADTQKLMQHVHARAEGVRAALVSLGEAEARRLCHDPSTAKAIEGAIRDVLDAAAEAALNLQRDPARGVPLVLALLACATTLARPLAVAAASLDLRTDEEVRRLYQDARASLLKKVYVIRERLEHHTGALRRSGARDKAAAQLSGGGLLMQLQLGRLELALRALHDSQLTGRGVSALAGIAHGIGAAFVGNPAALIKAGGQLFGVGLAKLGMEKARMLHRPLD